MKRSEKKLYTIDNPKKSNLLTFFCVFVLHLYIITVCLVVYQCNKDAKGFCIYIWIVVRK